MRDRSPLRRPAIAGAQLANVLLNRAATSGSTRNPVCSSADPPLGEPVSREPLLGEPGRTIGEAYAPAARARRMNAFHECVGSQRGFSRSRGGAADRRCYRGGGRGGALFAAQAWQGAGAVLDLGVARAGDGVLPPGGRYRTRRPRRGRLLI